ncbi:MAG: hypothetical protein MUF81_04115 [Verrucomicrobia bacterium]|nr:hypothetical protein [Verrucomicrobiota bacterium]
MANSLKMEDPVLYFGKRLNELSEFIDDNGVYLFMVFAWGCILAIAWLLFHKRKSPPPVPASARTRAIIGIMLASPGMSSDADGGRTRLIMGDVPSRQSNAPDSGCL